MYSRVLAISLWQRLDEWDKWLFTKLNSQWTNGFFDAVLPFFRNSVIWAPLYLFIIAFVALNYGKKGWWWMLAFICTVAITDIIGARVFKEGFERLRPCQDPAVLPHMRLLLKQCSGSFSFVSNHAANHFAIATFLVLTFRGLFRSWMYLAFVWSVLIGYAQIYVGVHYPLDVLAGAGLGTLIGCLMAWAFHEKWGTFNLDNQLK
ncbi:MAG TPA: phosphatase PAP2 family protein [Flavisolibacter sp.]|nr:phosphatase PAP2 family protein [Flavisolibacter sp.]